MMARALEMRKAGSTYAEIGTALNRTPGAILKMVRQALLDTIQEPADQVRALEVRRLDQLWRRLQPMIKHGGALGLKAIDTALHLMSRRAQLLGLDAPVRVEAPDGTPVSFVIQVPAQAASVAEWAAQASATVMDAATEDPVPTLGQEVRDEHAEE
jgi:hypothetical protein